MADINTPEVVKEVSRRMGCYAKDARELLEHFAALIAEETAKGRKVRFTPIGTFYLGSAGGRARVDGTRRRVLRFKPSRSFSRKLAETLTAEEGRQGDEDSV